MVRKLAQDIFLDCALHQPFLGQKDRRFRIFYAYSLGRRIVALNSKIFPQKGTLHLPIRSQASPLFWPQKF
jgi:hypothetical protein